MKNLLGLLLCVLAFISNAANPSFKSFDPNYFSTNSLNIQVRAPLSAITNSGTAAYSNASAFALAQSGTIVTQNASFAVTLNSGLLVTNNSGAINGTNVFEVDSVGNTAAFAVRTNGTVVARNGVGVGSINANASSIQMSAGAGSSEGYLEFFNGSTRRGYLGFGTATIPLNLENSASFQVLGGNQINSGSITVTGAVIQPFVPLTWSATSELDVAETVGNLKTVTLGGDWTPHSTNRASGRWFTAIITGAATNCAVTYPAWHWMSQVAPTTHASNKIASLTVVFTGSAETNGVANYSVEP